MGTTSDWQSISLGQTRPVFVYRFQAGGTFEDVLFNKAVFKPNSLSVWSTRRSQRDMRPKIDDYLFPVREVERQDFTDSLGKTLRP